MASFSPLDHQPGALPFNSQTVEIGVLDQATSKRQRLGCASFKPAQQTFFYVVRCDQRVRQGHPGPVRGGNDLTFPVHGGTAPRELAPYPHTDSAATTFGSCLLDRNSESLTNQASSRRYRDFGLGRLESDRSRIWHRRNSNGSRPLPNQKEQQQTRDYRRERVAQPSPARSWNGCLAGREHASQRAPVLYRRRFRFAESSNERCYVLFKRLNDSPATPAVRNVLLYANRVGRRGLAIEPRQKLFVTAMVHGTSVASCPCVRAVVRTGMPAGRPHEACAWNAPTAYRPCLG